jgi:hypothetical protein
MYLPYIRTDQAIAGGHARKMVAPCIDHCGVVWCGVVWWAPSLHALFVTALHCLSLRLPLHYIALHCIALFVTALHCIAFMDQQAYKLTTSTTCLRTGVHCALDQYLHTRAALRCAALSLTYSITSTTNK